MERTKGIQLRRKNMMMRLAQVRMGARKKADGAAACMVTGWVGCGSDQR
jgi:hypothetical protein